jgi:hypothetical protein
MSPYLVACAAVRVVRFDLAVPVRTEACLGYVMDSVIHPETRRIPQRDWTRRKCYRPTYKYTYAGD